MEDERLEKETEKRRLRKRSRALLNKLEPDP